MTNDDKLGMILMAFFSLDLAVSHEPSQVVVRVYIWVKSASDVTSLMEWNQESSRASLLNNESTTK